FFVQAEDGIRAYHVTGVQTCALPICSLRTVITGQALDSSALSATNGSWPAGTSSSGKIALAGHSGSHRVQSMHSSGSITRKFGPSWKQSTGHTSTQSVYLHLMQFSVTTKGMGRIFVPETARHSNTSLHRASCP